jgi:hypothetical protein
MLGFQVGKALFKGASYAWLGVCAAAAALLWLLAVAITVLALTLCLLAYPLWRKHA